MSQVCGIEGPAAIPCLLGFPFLIGRERFSFAVGGRRSNVPPVDRAGTMGEDGPPDAAGQEWRVVVPAVAVCLWLAAFWFLSPHSWHRALLGWLVIPSAALLPRVWRVRALRARWLWLAGLLLGWQVLGRSWSGGENSPPGWWFDGLLVGGLLWALVAGAQGPALGTLLVPGVSFVSAAAALVSLIAFYEPEERTLAVERLRNVFFHDDGLNAVPTGFLCAFGTLVAAWGMVEAGRRRIRCLHACAMGVSFLGLLASQSRGPMLMFVLGMLCLMLSGWRRMRGPMGITTGVALAFFGFLLVSGDGRDATLDLFERGSTGRVEIYRWFLGQMGLREILVGTGMGRAPVMPDEPLGWGALHPHSVYLTQFYQTGAVGLVLSLALLAVAFLRAAEMARRGEALWLALLCGGCGALVVDGSQVWSVYSLPRVEILLVAVPAAIAVGRAAAFKRPGGCASPVADKGS